MISRITLLGSSSGRNAGDAALISGIMDSIDQEMSARLLYEIPTIRPQFVWDNYENRVRPISMLPWSGSLKMLGLPTFQSIQRTDLSLIFDAILFDRQLYNPLFNFLSTLAIMLPVAKRRGKKLGCFNVGAGPVNTPRGKAMLRDVCELMDFITVRDEDSLSILRDIGVKNTRMVVTADAALSVGASRPESIDQIMRTLGLHDRSEILGINISAYLDTWASAGRESMGKARFIETYSKALSAVLREIKVPVLFICTQYHDVEVTKALMQATTAPAGAAIVSNRDHSHYDIKGVLSRVSLLFGMRLHAVILASSELTPVIALPHQPKVTHYLRTLGLEQRALSFDHFSDESLRRHILDGWRERVAIREQLKRFIPVQRARALMASKLVRALSEGRDLDAEIPNLEREIAALTPKSNLGGGSSGVPESQAGAKFELSSMLG